MIEVEINIWTEVLAYKCMCIFPNYDSEKVTNTKDTQILVDKYLFHLKLGCSSRTGQVWDGAESVQYESTKLSGDFI